MCSLKRTSERPSYNFMLKRVLRGLFRCPWCIAAMQLRHSAEKIWPLTFWSSCFRCVFCPSGVCFHFMHLFLCNGFTVTSTNIFLLLNFPSITLRWTLSWWGFNPWALLIFHFNFFILVSFVSHNPVTCGDFFSFEFTRFQFTFVPFICNYCLRFLS